MLEDGVAVLDPEFGGDHIALRFQKEIVIAPFADAGFEIAVPLGDDDMRRICGAACSRPALSGRLEDPATERRGYSWVAGKARLWGDCLFSRRRGMDAVALHGVGGFHPSLGQGGVTVNRAAQFLCRQLGTNRDYRFRDQLGGVQSDGVSA